MLLRHMIVAVCTCLSVPVCVYTFLCNFLKKVLAVSWVEKSKAN